MFFTNAGPASRLECELRARIHRARVLAQRGDRGASAIEWVIISAVIIIIVGVVAGILRSRITEAANTIDLNNGIQGGGGGGNP